MSKKIIYLLIVYLILQIILALLIDIPFTSDSLRYFNLSLNNINHGVLYPSKFNLYDAYITSPLYINIVSFFLLFYKQQATIIVLNIFLNSVQLVLVYKIALKILNNASQAFIAGLLYTCYLTNLGAVFFNFTELFYGVLLLLSFFYYLKETNYHYILSGIFLALAINTRQTAFALLAGYGAVYLYNLIKEREKNHRRILLITSSAFIILFLIGVSTKINYGHFVAFSDTGAINILMGANDDASGTYNDRVFKKGKTGYLEEYDSYTHFEKAAFWKNQAKSWIKQHPFKWLMLFPLKLGYMYGLDDWSVYALTNSDKWNSYTIARLILKEKQPQKVFAGESDFFIARFLFIYLVHYLYYFTLLFLILYQFFFYKKHPQLKKKYFREIYLFALTGTLVTLLAVGLARYKYNYIIFLLPTIAPLVSFYLQKKFPNLKFIENE